VPAANSWVARRRAHRRSVPRKEKQALDNSEAVLTDLWCEVLSLEPGDLAPGDDFFERGGDSLLATVVVTRLRDDFGLNVRLRTLFDNPTVESLSAHLGTM
jgi:acyl carrier protein